MKVLIVEEKRTDAVYLEEIIKLHFPNVIVLPIATSIIEAEAELGNKPDIVFLGLPFAGKIDLEFNSLYKGHTVITSGIKEFVSKTFNETSKDFLLKPIIPQELVRAIIRCLSKNVGEKESKVKEIKESADKRVKLNTTVGHNYVAQNDIIYLESKGVNTVVKLNTGRLLVVKSLASVLRQLDDQYFMRINHMQALNKLFIEECHGGSNTLVTMSSGECFTVSSRRQNEFVNFMGRSGI